MTESPTTTGMYPRYSVSQVNTYIACPKKWEYRYVKGISPRTSTPSLVFGTSIHSGMEHNFSQKIYTREDLPKSRVVDAFAEKMESENNSVDVDWNGKMGEYVDMGAGLLNMYIGDFSRPIQPKVVEQDFVINIPGVSKPFMGIVDLIGVDFRIIDFKTASRKPSVFDVRKNLLQLSSYTYSVIQSRNNREIFSERDSVNIEKIKAFNTRLDFLVKTKTPQVHVRPVMRNKDDLRRFVTIVQQTCKSMESGIYPPNPTSTLCSPKYCVYWERCNKDLSEDSYIKLHEGT
jgi:CRISPR/Cas system-associated exonuclease Cas4 (RecB family)